VGAKGRKIQKKSHRGINPEETMAEKIRKAQIFMSRRVGQGRHGGKEVGEKKTVYSSYILKKNAPQKKKKAAFRKG